MDKAKSAAKQFCQQLGQYRMPLAWTAINVVDIITGSKSASQGDAVPTPPEKGLKLNIYTFLSCVMLHDKMCYLSLYFIL